MQAKHSSYIKINALNVPVQVFPHLYDVLAGGESLL